MQSKYLKRKNEEFRILYVFIILILFLMGSCKSIAPVIQKETLRVNTQESFANKALLQRIQTISQKGYAFGHQDATAYGIGWKNDGITYRSDVKDVSGDHPAVYGFEIGHIELAKEQNLDTVSFKLITKLVKKAHEDGGIITISWHPNNPTSNKSAWNTRKTVKHILSGGKHHKKYRLWLSRLAAFLKDLKTANGSAIPIIFRPYHEMNGGWFWWGKGHCSPEEYIRLWQETVFILNQDFGVQNVLYAYSPNTFASEKEYLQYYPGDNFVDILGVDIYQHWTTASFIKDLKSNTTLLKTIATRKNKPYALTEAGLNKVSKKDWWTRVLDQNIADSGIAWALFWRNARPSHFFGPYPGQISSNDFKEFKKLPHVLFLKDIKTIK